MDYKNSPYFHVAHARDLEGKGDRFLYRIFEIIPFALTAGTFLLVILLSWFLPVWAAIFIIIFDLYWLLKTIHLSYHHHHNWKRLQHNWKTDWQSMLKDFKYEDIYHLVLLPFLHESEEVLEGTIRGLSESKYPTNRLIIVLGAEERQGQSAVDIAERIKSKYEDKFAAFIVNVHPSNIPGEFKGKGANITHMSRTAKKKYIDPQGIPYENVICSAFDCDTVVYDQYFSCLTWHFLNTEDRQNTSYQPVPLYNNNLWHAPAFSRVAAMTSTFWQMIQQERPEKLITFSGHSIPFKSLVEVDFWQKNMISDDSRIFWNIYLAKNGNYKVVPLSYPISMDANQTPKITTTFKNTYKQHLRWMWGAAENAAYIYFAFWKMKSIPLKEKIKHVWIQTEGSWSMATNPIMILILGWLPIILGGPGFRDTVLSYNLPNITRDLMTIATMGLILSAIIASNLLPPVPEGLKHVKKIKVIMVLQWVLVPFTILLFGAFPAIHAQFKLAFKRYFNAFWVTPKHRKS